MSQRITRTERTAFQVRPLIGALALALAAPAALAAPPAGALPGSFYTNVSGAAYTGNGTTATISYSATGAVVMQWGASSSSVASTVSPTLANSTGAAMNNVAGFNIGAGATLNIKNTNSTTTGNYLLISDVTGQASQIFGTLNATNTGDLFIANANGVVLGSSGTITGASTVGILGYAQDVNAFVSSGASAIGLNVAPGQTLISKGDVTVAGTVSGASGTASVLIAGAGNVNVTDNGSGNGWNIIAGENFSGTTASGAFAGGSSAVVNLIGGPSASSAGFASVSLAAAGNVNLSNYVHGAGLTSASIAGTLTNNGVVVSASNLAAGAVVNNGQINASSGTALTLTANTGSVTNNGIINASGAVTLQVNSSSNTSGNVINNVSILNATNATLSAGASSGTATNNGTINYAASGDGLSMSGFNVNLYGTVNTGTTATALSSTNTLSSVNLSAATAGGVLNLGTSLFASGGSNLTGAAVRVISGGLTDTAGLTINIGSGPVTSGSNTYGYNLSVFPGATLSAGTASTITISGSTGASGSNINLDGTVAGQTINVQANNINGLGGFNITTSSGGSLTATFSGNFNAPNGAAARGQAGNFLYNYVPVTVASNGSATITLDPTNTANAAQFVNVLVNGSATLGSSLLASPVSTSGSIVAQPSYPNSHLVVQATGNLTLGNSSGFYWPGLMYFGTINAGQPGSLNTLGSITLGGNVSNVIPTNVTSGGGIWFMTKNPLNINGKTVLTNTNSWINFPAATGFAAAYGAQNATTKTFYGMVPNSTVNTILQTNVLSPSMFYGR